MRYLPSRPIPLRTGKGDFLRLSGSWIEPPSRSIPSRAKTLGANLGADTSAAAVIGALSNAMLGATYWRKSIRPIPRSLRAIFALHGPIGGFSIAGKPTMNKPTIRHLTRPFDHDSDDFLAIWKELEEASARTSVIVAAVVVEDALRWSMESYLIADLTDDDRRTLFENEGAPLSSFHGKIMMGYAIGMYGPAAKTDLSAIKRIRNAFAHATLRLTSRRPRSFQSATDCATSKLPKQRLTGKSCRWRDR
jgi:hypothetical protein